MDASMFSLDPLDLAALLCSRVCHDVISPVGAIANGLEVLESEKDPDMRGFAMDLIKKSATSASARLQFCRLAFGAAGSAGASIDTGDAESVARGLIADEKTRLEWNAVRALLPKNKVKLILNLVLIAGQAIPRGGTVAVTIDGNGNDMTFTVTATGTNAKLQSHTPRLLAGEPENGVDAHGIQAYYAGLIAREAHLSLSATVENGMVTLTAVPDGTSLPALDTGMIGVAVPVQKVA
jgi:histidine phosphotransferase ChpT